MTHTAKPPSEVYYESVDLTLHERPNTLLPVFPVICLEGLE